VSVSRQSGGSRGAGRPLDAEALVHMAAAAASEVKPSALVHLDLRGLCSFTDHFLVASATSFRQLGAIAERIEQRLQQEQVRLLHREGEQESGWILLDYNDVIIHIFDEQTRLYYDLEGLWGDAPRQDLMNEGSAVP